MKVEQISANTTNTFEIQPNEELEVYFKAKNKTKIVITTYENNN